MFEEKLLRIIFGSKRKEATGGRRKLHNLYLKYEGDQVESNDMRGHVARIEKIRNSFRILVGRNEGYIHGSIILKLNIDKWCEGVD
jgi:hypothetical protein